MHLAVSRVKVYKYRVGVRGVGGTSTTVYVVGMIFGVVFMVAGAVLIANVVCYKMKTRTLVGSIALGLCLLVGGVALIMPLLGASDALDATGGKVYKGLVASISSKSFGGGASSSEISLSGNKVLIKVVRGAQPKGAELDKSFTLPDSAALSKYSIKGSISSDLKLWCFTITGAAGGEVYDQDGLLSRSVVACRDGVVEVANS